jgi:hypothetical protein
MRVEPRPGFGLDHHRSGSKRNPWLPPPVSGANHPTRKLINGGRYFPFATAAARISLFTISISFQVDILNK